MLPLSGGERCHECRDLRVDPAFVVIALIQVQAWCELPRELGEELVLLIRPGKRPVCAGLTVVVPQILVSREEPEPVANHGTTEIGREITVLHALVPGLRLAGRDRQPHRLAGQAGRLAVVRRVVLKAIAPLSGDDIENRALKIAVFGGGSRRLDLHFLNEINTRLSARDAGARTGEVRAVDEKQVLIAAGAEH